VFSVHARQPRIADRAETMFFGAADRNFTVGGDEKSAFFDRRLTGGS
jgi:hypothetical protein